MSSKYGKWEVEHDGRSVKTLAIWRTSDEQEVMPMKIATVNSSQRISLSEAKENAELIAAAPEMYAALEALIPHLKAFNLVYVVKEVEKILARVDGREA